MEKLVNVKLVDLKPSPFNPRKHFDEVKIGEMAESMKVVGVALPLVARPKGKKYEIVLGERRFRAAKKAKLHKVPVVVKELTDQECMKLQLVENMMREDPTPLEQAEQFKALMDGGMTETEIGAMIGKSQPFVSDRIRLLGLPKRLHKHINEGTLGPGHAKAMLKLKKPKDQLAIAKQLTKYDGEFQPSVRETERVVSNYLEEQDEREEFEKVYRKAKVKKCPDCGNKAVKINKDVKKKTALTCRKFRYSGEKGHNWDPETGERLMTQAEIQAEAYRKQQAKEAAATRKKKLGKGETHIPTMPAWFFSRASKQEWTETILKEASKDLYWATFGPPGHYSPRRAEAVLQATFSSNPLVSESVLIQPVEDRPAAKGFKTRLTIGSYRSTSSLEDNVAREKENVAKVKAAIKKLLDFQRKKVGVKQTAKDIMIKEVDGFKLGSKVKVKKSFSMKSYQGAGAEIVGFDQDGKAVLNYSRTQKIVSVGDLELVVKKG